MGVVIEINLQDNFCRGGGRGAVQVCILCISDRRKSRLETVGNLFTVTMLRSSRAGNESHIF